MIDDKNKQRMWVEKYRPGSLDEVQSHQSIIVTLKRFIEQDKIPHLLFYGPPGTGKTSTILAASNEIYKKRKKQHVLELNASDERGISVVRKEIKTFASTRGLSSKRKLIILDEADQMTHDAQNALRRVIELYTSNTRFCIICNYINKIIPAIQSRCSRFRFGPLDPLSVRRRMEHIAKIENLTYTPAALNTIVKICQGDMRKCIMVLQSVAMTRQKEGRITAEHVYDITGTMRPNDTMYVIDLMLNEPMCRARSQINELKYTRGIALIDLVQSIFEVVLRMKLNKDAYSFIIQQLASIEANLAKGASEQVQLSSLVSIFTLVKTSLLDKMMMKELSAPFYGEEDSSSNIL